MRLAETETDWTGEAAPLGRESLRAARLTGPGQFDITEGQIPSPGADEVLVRLEGCGVCASNLTPWAGPDWMEYPTAPGEPGHEGWGVIEAVGDGVIDRTPGQRVATLGHNSYASHEVVEAGVTVPLPPELDGQPFPGEALGCAMNIFRRCKIEKGQTVAIIGVGFLGAILTRLAAEAGAEVIAISRRESSLVLARRMGAARSITMDDHYRIIEEVSKLTEGRFCDVVIEAVGKQWPLDLAAELTAERGRLVVAGYHQDGPRQVNMQHWNWRGIDVINAHERDPEVYLQGIRDAVEAVVAGRLELDALLTHSYPLDRLDQALNETRDKPEGFVKGWVACN